jgi:hypothetical protein
VLGDNSYIQMSIPQRKNDSGRNESAATLLYNKDGIGKLCFTARYDLPEGYEKGK